MACWSKRPGKLLQCVHREVAEGISLQSSADRRVLRRDLGSQWRARRRKRRERPMAGGLEREMCLRAICGVEDMEMIEGATECHHTTELPDPDWEIVPLKVPSPLYVTLFFVM